MDHRHLDHDSFTLPGVDDIIRRGGWRDWVALRRAAVGDPAVRERIHRLCVAAERDLEAEGAQRLTFWKKYVQRLAASVG